MSRLLGCASRPGVGSPRARSANQLPADTAVGRTRDQPPHSGDPRRASVTLRDRSGELRSAEVNWGDLLNSRSGGVRAACRARSEGDGEGDVGERRESRPSAGVRLTRGLREGEVR